MTVLEAVGRRVRRSGDNPVLKIAPWPTWPWSSSAISGATVNDESALGLTAFYRGVSLIASTIASLPLHIYSENADGTSTRLKTDDTRYLWARPNVEMTRPAMWERVIADEVRGNGFIFVEKDDIGRPTEIWHIERQRVQVGRNSARQKVYQIDNELPMIDFRDGGEIIHIPNWGDGIAGYDIVKLAREAIALGLSAEEFAARTFANGEVPPGLITTDAILTEAQADAISARWTRLRSGQRNRQKVAVLGSGAKFQQTSLDFEKVQMESLRKFQAGEIATLLGIPPHMLGQVEKTTSWGSGIEEQTRGFVTFTLQAHIKRVEPAIDDALLVRELTDRYSKFDLGGLLRGTTLQRYQAYAQGYGRWLTANDIRRDEDLPPIEGGDDLLAAVNLLPIDQLGGPSDGNGA